MAPELRPPRLSFGEYPSEVTPISAGRDQRETDLVEPREAWPSVHEATRCIVGHRHLTEHFTHASHASRWWLVEQRGDTIDVPCDEQPTAPMLSEATQLTAVVRALVEHVASGTQD
jgi:hypothetical protein